MVRERIWPVLPAGAWRDMMRSCKMTARDGHSVTFVLQLGFEP